MDSESSRELIERDLAVLWHPCSQMRDYRPPDGFTPLPVIRAHGCRLELTDGREVLDAISSWWCKSLGHGHARLRAALIDQAEKFEHVILANTTNEQIVRLSERLVNLCNTPTPLLSGSEGAGLFSPSPHFSKVFYADNGSTAVEIALKMALQAQAQRGQPQRTRFASLANGYHGETAGALSVSDCDLYINKPYAPMMFDVAKLTGLPYRAGPEDPRWMDASHEWSAIESQLDAVADTLAAIIYEPILQGAGNMMLYSPDLLGCLRRWADAHDVYLIADEIAAGMGRLGAMLASHLAAEGARGEGQGMRGKTNQNAEHPADPERAKAGTSLVGAPASSSSLAPRPSSLTPTLPDFATISKGLTGGYLPLSAVVTTDAVYELFDADYLEGKAFLHSNTYTGHALAVAVANAALDVYEEEHILDLVRERGPLLRQGLADIARDRSGLRNVRGCGMMAAADLRHSDGSPLDPRHRTGYQVYRKAVEHPHRPALLRALGDTMYLLPPLNTEPADIDAMLATLADSIDQVHHP